MLRIFNVHSHFNSLILGRTCLSNVCAQFATSHQRYNNSNIMADSVLKNYFNMRNTLSNASVIDMIDKIKNLKVSSSFFNDHRWIHLNVAIQKNLSSFSVKQQFKILQGLVKLNHFNDLFNATFNSLTTKIQSLYPDEQAHLLYFIAKKGSASPETIKKICDSLMISLNKKDIKTKFGNKKSQKNKNDKNEKDDQTLFDEAISTDFKDTKQLEVSIRNLILCLWALQKLKIKDQLLTQCIIKEYLKPNLDKLSTDLFPLLLSTLWLKNMQNKRIYEDATYQIYKRQADLLQLDRDKLKMLICMLCKPEINKKEAHSKIENQNQVQNTKKQKQQQELSNLREKLVLWLMQTLLIKHQNGEQYIFPTSAYQIITNSSQANIVDEQLFQKYITLICTDLSKIQTKQIIYLLSIIYSVRKLQKQSNNAQRRKLNKQNIQKLFCETQRKILNDNFVQNALSYFHKISEDHPSRVILRKMVLKNFIQLPINMRKKLIYEQKTNNRQVLKKQSKQENNQNMQQKQKKINKNNNQKMSNIQQKSKQSRQSKKINKQVKNHKKVKNISKEQQI